MLPLVTGAADSRADTRRRIEDTLFVPNPRPPLEVETYGQVEPAPGVIAERVGTNARNTFQFMGARCDRIVRIVLARLTEFNETAPQVQ